MPTTAIDFDCTGPEDADAVRCLLDGSDVPFLDAGHLWPFEAVKETVEVTADFVYARHPS